MKMEVVSKNLLLGTFDTISDVDDAAVELGVEDLLGLFVAYMIVTMIAQMKKIAAPTAMN
jgi:hypothetical protein